MIQLRFLILLVFYLCLIECQLYSKSNKAIVDQVVSANNSTERELAVEPPIKSTITPPLPPAPSVSPLSPGPSVSPLQSVPSIPPVSSVRSVTPDPLVQPETSSNQNEDEIKVIDSGTFVGGVFGKRDTEKMVKNDLLSVQKRQKISTSFIKHGLLFNSRGKRNIEN